MSYVFEDRQSPEQLVQAYRELLKRDCESPGETRWKLIEQLIEVGNTSEAHTQWDQLSQQHAELAQQRRPTKVKLLMLEGQTEQADAIVDEILHESPEDLEALLLRGKLSLGEEFPDRAIESLQTLVRLDPSHPEAHYLLGQAYAKADRREEAERHLEIHDRLSTTLTHLHRLERQAAIHTRDPQIRREIAALYEELGLTEPAEYWRAAADALPQP